MIRPQDIQGDAIISQLKQLGTLQSLLASGDGENMVKFILATSQTEGTWAALPARQHDVYQCSAIGRLCWHGEHKGFDLNDDGGLQFSSWMLEQLASAIAL